MERKRPGVGKPLTLPGGGIADCRDFPGVVDMIEGYMSSKVDSVEQSNNSDNPSRDGRLRPGQGTGDGYSVSLSHHMTRGQLPRPRSVTDRRVLIKSSLLHRQALTDVSDHKCTRLFVRFFLSRRYLSKTCSFGPCCPI